MSQTNLFLVGMFVFVMMLTGLFLTMREFKRISERPDLYKGDLRPRPQAWPSDSAVSSADR
jgi:hypothetical protein